MKLRGVALALCLTLPLFNTVTAIESAVASPTSAMLDDPEPIGGKLSMNTVHTFNGTLRCATYGFNNALVYLKVEGYADLEMQYRSFLPQNIANQFPVDQNAPNGDQTFQVSFNTTGILTAETKVLRAKWLWWDCAGNLEESSRWTYIQAPATTVKPVDVLEAVGDEPTVSFEVRTYPVYSSAHPPMEQRERLEESGIFSSPPTCLFDSWGDQYTAAELALQSDENEYDIECSGAVLSSTESWRADAVSNQVGWLQTHNPDSLPIAASLFADLRADNGNEGLGVFESAPFSESTLAYSFTPDDFYSDGLNFRYGLIDRDGTSIEFEGCSQNQGWGLESSTTEPYALSPGKIDGLFSASLVRLYLINDQPMCDTILLLDMQSNEIAGIPLDVGFSSTTSSYVLSEDGGTIYHFELPEHSTESQSLLILDAVAEVTLPSGISLSSLVMTSDQDLLGLEVTNSHSVLHTLNIQDVSGSPVVSSLTISDLIQSWEETSEKYVSAEAQSGDFWSVEIRNLSDTQSKVVTLNLSDFSAVAVIEDLDESWCPVAQDLGYHFTNQGYIFGCYPSLLTVTSEGMTMLATADLQILRTPSASGGVVHTEPERDFSHATGLDEDNYSAWRFLLDVSPSLENVWVLDSDVTFRSLSLPAALYLQPSVSQVANPAAPIPSDGAIRSSFLPALVPDLKLQANYQRDSKVFIEMPISDLVEVKISGTAVSLSATASGSIFSLRGIAPGNHDLTVVTTNGAFTFAQALRIVEASFEPTGGNSLVRVGPKTPVSKVLKALRELHNFDGAIKISCAYHASRVAARSKCGAVAKKLNIEVVLVKVRESLAPAGQLLLRLKN